MKKFLNLFTILLVALSFTITYSISATSDKKDEILTIENNQELKEILESKDPGDKKIAAFAKKYHGRKIEFDAYTASVAPHGKAKTRFDYLLYAGNYDNESLSGPNFQLFDVNYYDLHLEGEDVPDTFGVDLNIRIVATVESYQENSELFRIKPVKITMRHH